MLLMDALTLWSLPLSSCWKTNWSKDAQPSPSPPQLPPLHKDARRGELPDLCTALGFAHIGRPSWCFQMLQASCLFRLTLCSLSQGILWGFFRSSERQRTLLKSAPHLLCVLLPEVMARKKICLPCEEQRPCVHSTPLTFSCVMNGDLVISSQAPALSCLLLSGRRQASRLLSPFSCCPLPLPGHSSPAHQTKGLPGLQS